MPPANRNVVVLDPAHGGQDHGATLNGAMEKDLTLSLAAYLRASLTSRGMTVITTRDADLPAATPVLTSDQRASVANHPRPLACIVLHATAVGSGIHIAMSALEPPQTPADATAAVPWDLAQAAYIPQSLHLANTLGLALLQAKVPVLLTRAALRPLDNLTCPAIAIEVAPLQAGGGRGTPVADPGYQYKLAETLAAAIVNWRNRFTAADARARP